MYWFAVKLPEIITAPVTFNVDPSNCKFCSPLINPDVPVAVKI